MNKIYLTYLVKALIMVLIASNATMASESNKLNIRQASGDKRSDAELKDPELASQPDDSSAEPQDYQQKMLSDKRINDLARMKSLTGNGANVAIISQKGNSNKSSVTQAGKYNYSKQTQDGENNDIHIEQNGDYNNSIEKQNGAHNHKIVIQNGQAKETNSEQEN